MLVRTNKKLVLFLPIKSFLLYNRSYWLVTKHLQQVIYQRNDLFDKRKIKYLSQIKPSIPAITPQLKIHKD